MVDEERITLGDLFKERAKSGKIPSLNVGSNVEIVLDAFGKAVNGKLKTNRVTGYQYGVVTAAKTGNVFDDGLSLKVFTSLGIFEIFEVSDNPYVDEEKMQNAKAVYNALCYDGENGELQAELVPQLIRFKTNLEGVLTHIDRVGSYSPNREGLYRLAMRWIINIFTPQRKI